MKFWIKASVLFVVLFAGAAFAQTLSTQPPRDESNDTATQTSNAQIVETTHNHGTASPQQTTEAKQAKPLSVQEARKLLDDLKTTFPQTTQAPTIVRLPDGTKKVSLNGVGTYTMLARVNQDGTTTTTCVNTLEEAAEFFGIAPEFVAEWQKTNIPSDAARATNSKTKRAATTAVKPTGTRPKNTSNELELQ